MKHTEVLHQNLHMQGFSTDGENMYWSFTDSLVKTKKSGLMLRQVPIPAGHLGDIVYYNGKIYGTVLGNSLVILSGAVSADEARVIADEIVRDSMTPTSLSMNILKYEALLSVDAEEYKDYILSEIRRTYKIMLDAGSDTVWETILGEADFNGAGSLCHGWSAVPIYVYRRLGMVK